jgi:hypothetical protein
MLQKFHFIAIWVSNLITEFERKLENKINLWQWTLIDQEWHITLEMPTSRTLMPRGKERDTYNTTTRQSLSN